MKILFYGGCHASAFRRIAEQFSSGTHQFDHLTNYSMIQRGEPFPFEFAAGFDLIIFSPIMNKGDWNTDRLETFCAKIGIPFIKFPWIQWEGYFPGMKKLNLGWHAGWWNVALKEEATKYENFDLFYQAVLEGDVLANEAKDNLNKTTNTLRLREQESEVLISISDFITDNYQAERLMLTPDHASTSIYKHIFRQIEDIVGKVVDPGFYHTAMQIQHGLESPILPSVARALDLRFAGSDYRNIDFSGDALIILKDYLRLQYFAPRIARISANANTRIKLIIDDPESFVSIPAGESFITQFTGEAWPNHQRAHFISPASRVRSRSAGLMGSQYWLYNSHWDVVPMWD